MPKEINWDEFSDEELLFMLAFGEARGEPVECQIGVCHVAVNRAKRPGWWGKTLREVILKPYQFSSFNEDDPNFQKLFEPDKHERPEVIKQLWWVVEGVIQEKIMDNTGGATYYHDTSIKPPVWVSILQVSKRMGKLIFYKEA